MSVEFLSPPPSAPRSDELIRIGELARRVDVTPDVLRVWERRYGVLSPVRTDGGFRLYSTDDERRVREMCSRIARGMAPAEAAAGIGPPDAGRAARAATDPAAELTAAMAGFDEAAVGAVIDRVGAALGTDALITGVMIPFLRDLGERWRRGDASVAQEHFVTGVVRNRLLELSDREAGGDDPHALVACPPDELHDLPIVMMAAALRTRGWRVTLLGSDTPVAALGEAADQLAPDVIILGSPFAERYEAVARGLARIGTAHNLAIGGAGATRRLVARVGGTHLTGDPVASAARLTAAAMHAGRGH